MDKEKGSLSVLPSHRWQARIIDILLWTPLALMIQVPLLLFFSAATPRLAAKVSEEILTTLAITGAISICLLMVIDTIIGTVFGNTPGKTLMNISVSRDDGGELTARNRFKRNLGFASLGFGFGFPVLNLLFMSIQYFLTRESGKTTYDKAMGFSVTQTAPVGIKRSLLCAVVFIIAIIISSLSIRLANAITKPHGWCIGIEACGKARGKHFEETQREKQPAEVKDLNAQTKQNSKSITQPPTATTATTATTQEYASTETIISDLKSINRDAGDRIRVLNEPIKELMQRSPQVELLQSDQLLSSYGIMEQERWLTVLNEVLSIRKQSQDDIRNFEISEFIKTAKNNSYPPSIIKIFDSQSKIAAQQDSEFPSAQSNLFYQIKNVLDFMKVKHMEATIDSDGRIGFSSPLLTGEYEALILKVHAAKSRTKLVKSREKSISVMTIEMINNSNQQSDKSHPQKNQQLIGESRNNSGIPEGYETNSTEQIFPDAIKRVVGLYLGPKNEWPVNVVISPHGKMPMTKCGALPAAYCPADNTIAFSSDFMLDATTQSTLATPFIVGHEIAHAYITNNGIQPKSPVLRELAADCLSGKMLAKVFDIEGADSEETHLNMARFTHTIGDSNYQSINHHGFGSQRYMAYMIGYTGSILAKYGDKSHENNCVTLFYN